MPVAMTPPPRTPTDSSTTPTRTCSSTSYALDKFYETCGSVGCHNLASVACGLMPSSLQMICRDHALAGIHRDKSHDGSHHYANAAVSLIARKACQCPATGGFIANQTIYCTCKGGVYGCDNCKASHNGSECSVQMIEAVPDDEKKAMIAVVDAHASFCSRLFRNQRALHRAASRERADKKEHCDDAKTVAVWRYINMRTNDTKPSDRKLTVKEVEDFAVCVGYTTEDKSSTFVSKLSKCKALETVKVVGSDGVETPYLRARSSFSVQNNKMIPIK